MKIGLILVPYDSAQRGTRMGDFNSPETTTGGFLDGMALAAITSRCFVGLSSRLPDFVPVREQDAWLLGTRDLDPAEEKIARLGHA